MAPLRFASLSADPPAYPGKAPARSCVLDAGEVRWLDAGEPLGTGFEGRLAVWPSA